MLEALLFCTEIVLADTQLVVQHELNGPSSATDTSKEVNASMIDYVAVCACNPAS